MIISGGSQTVYSGGVDTNATINSGGSQIVQSGGTVSGTNVNNGGVVQIFIGGTASDMSVNGGGQASIQGTNVLGGTTSLNSGSIYLTRIEITQPVVLTIDNLNGSGGTVNINISMSGNDSSDRIVITSSHEGNSILRLNNAGGDNVQDEGLQLVHYEDPANANGTFSIAGGKLDNGWYEYELTRGGSEAGTEKDYYLRSNGRETPVARTIAAAPEMANAAITVSLNSLQKRLGELRGMGNSSAKHGIWGRAYYKSMTVKGNGGTEMGIGGLEAGYDFRLDGFPEWLGGSGINPDREDLPEYDITVRELNPGDDLLKEEDPFKLWFGNDSKDKADPSSDNKVANTEEESSKETSSDSSVPNAEEIKAENINSSSEKAETSSKTKEKVRNKGVKTRGEGLYLGVMAGNMSVSDIKNSDSRTSGSGSGILAGIYGTYISENAWFADFTLRGGNNSLELTTYSSSDKLTLKPERSFIAISAEAGKAYRRHYKGTAFTLEPKAELQFINVGSASTKVENGTGNAKFDGSNYINAIGTLNVAYQMTRANGMELEPYAELVLQQALSGSETIRYSDHSKTTSMTGTTVEARLGLNMQLTSNLYWHGTASMETGSISKSYGIDGGIRYMFGK